MPLPASSTTTTTTTTTTITTKSSRASPMSIRPHSEFFHRYALELGPVFRNSVKVNTALFVFAQQFLHINRAALAYLLFGCQVAALHALLAAKELATMSVTALSNLVWGAWNSKQSRQLRKKLEFEFFVLILGCGNSFILMLFWPGWILIGLLYLVYLLYSWAG